MPSPTWIANRRYKFSGIDAETIKTSFCQHNAIKGCENTLSGTPPDSSSKAPGCQ